jgi:hypothetical protein
MNSKGDGNGIEHSVSRICIYMKCLKIKFHKMPGCIVLTLLQNPIFLGFLIMCLLFLCGHLSIILMLLYH